MMTRRRIQHLEQSRDPHLSPREIEVGWHWCREWDGLLVGPGMGELEFCQCLPKDHRVYETIPPIEAMDDQTPPF